MSLQEQVVSLLEERTQKDPNQLCSHLHLRTGLKQHYELQKQGLLVTSFTTPHL